MFRLIERGRIRVLGLFKVKGVVYELRYSFKGLKYLIMCYFRLD